MTPGDQLIVAGGILILTGVAIRALQTAGRFTWWHLRDAWNERQWLKTFKGRGRASTIRHAPNVTSGSPAPRRTLEEQPHPKIRPRRPAI